jgi:acyl carrier protein
MSSVFERVKAILVKQLRVDEDNVTSDALIIDDLGADSIDTVELIMAFENEFGVDIPEATGMFDKVEDVVKYIEANQA